MIIKKFKAKSENEAILMAKDELGSDAIVMNIKTKKPRGIMRLFKKSEVEITAAVDESDKKDTVEKKEPEKKSFIFGEAFASKKDEYSEDAQNAIEEKINSIAKLLEQQITATPKDDSKSDDSISSKYTSDDDSAKAEKVIHSDTNSKSRVVGLIKSQLLENEVNEKNADIITDELDNDEKIPLDNVLANAYQKIVLKLGQIEPLKATENKPKLVFFVGNTGVGKTTTMAKLASKLKLEQKQKIALFSVDTYRIAAIDQLKTYANILNTPLEVVYTPEDMKNNVEKYKDCDFILVDTAGRSHRNAEQKKDLSAIIDSVEGYEKEIYLVVSVTVKYSDLISIASSYDELFDYKIIFTKLDETKGLGNMLNLKLDTGKILSYVTWGQNVPDDIGLLDPQIIAKKLLGGAD